MKIWIIVSVMFLMENAQVKIAETVNDSSRFFSSEKQEKSERIKNVVFLQHFGVFFRIFRGFRISRRIFLWISRSRDLAPQSLPRENSS